MRRATLTFATFLAAVVCCANSVASRAATVDTPMRVFTINDHVWAFYTGRPPQPKDAMASTDWADSGAYDVGVCTYVIHRGDRALVYDTYPSVVQARWVRDYLESHGIRHFMVVNSHWHLDHVGGNAVYADVDRLATRRTIEILRAKRAAIEAGTEWGPPRILPLVIPNVPVDGERTLEIGDVAVQLRPIDIHSADGLVLYIPADRLLFAGDTLEDTVTFVSEPEGLADHARNLKRMRSWNIARILPNHGNPQVIATGGYQPTLIDATLDYITRLTRRVGQPGFLDGTLEDYVGDSVARGWVSVWWAYRDAHAMNLKRVAETYKDRAAAAVSQRRAISSNP